MRRLLLATSLLCALASGANAQIATTTLGGQTWTGTGTLLTLTPTVPGGNQPLNVQCIICGANQPQQASTFGYTNFSSSGNLADVAFFSTNVSGGANPGFDTLGTPYSGTFLQNYLTATGAPNLNFSIGIDVNDTNVAQTLESFYLLNLSTHTILAAYSPGPGGTLIPSQNNGTGFPDYTLTGLTLNGINPGDNLLFYARISGQNDGPDSFFLIPTPGVTAVPGPIAGAGLPGLFSAGCLWWFARRRRQRALG